MTKMRFTQAARKQRIGTARVISAIENNYEAVPVVTNRGEDGTRYTGPDPEGGDLDIIVVEGADYDLVIHVRPANYRRN